MTQTFQLQELDCPNCAAKMESEIRKIKGVESAAVSFMTGRLTLAAPEDQFADVLKKAQKICKKIEPDCKIVTR